TLDRTRAATEKSQRAVEWLCEEGMPPSLIVTLHRQNASEDRLPILVGWMRRLASLGISSVRLHLLEIDNPETRQRYALTTRENIEALMAFGRLQFELTRLQFDVFADMAHMLLGQDNIRHGTTCVWNACDPYTTRAVRGIEGNGQKTNCGRTNKEGIDFV